MEYYLVLIHQSFILQFSSIDLYRPVPIVLDLYLSISFLGVKM